MLLVLTESPGVRLEVRGRSRSYRRRGGSRQLTCENPPIFDACNALKFNSSYGGEKLGLELEASHMRGQPLSGTSRG